LSTRHEPKFVPSNLITTARRKSIKVTKIQQEHEEMFDLCGANKTFVIEKKVVNIVHFVMER